MSKLVGQIGDFLKPINFKLFKEFNYTYVNLVEYIVTVGRIELRAA